MLKPALLSLAVAACLIVPSAAQTVTTPVRSAPITKGVTTGDLSLQVDQTRQQTADMLVQVNQLQGQISTLNGRVEALEFELSRARETNDDLLSDNETLIRDMAQMRRSVETIQTMLGITPEPVAQVVPEQGTSAGPVELAAPAPGPASASASALPEGSLGTLPASQLPGEAGPLFAEAKARLIAQDNAGAEEAFEAFITKFGKDPQVGEAHFWLGEALFRQEAYADSGAAYTTLIRSYPDNERAPDALVRLARTLRILGENEKACTALNTLPKRYPKAEKIVRDIAAVERTQAGCGS